MSNGFEKLGIRESLVQSLQSSGVTDPTPIQRQAIPALLSGADVIAQAQTGTGKTLAFVLPMLELIDAEKPHVQGLILTPTRELAIQISSELSKLAPLVGVKVLAAYGGQDVERQLRKLQGTIHIVVGTPGRILDHLRRESVQFFKLNMLVLDEADQMLHMGFLNEVKDIIAQTSSRRQTLLFSATMPQQIRNLAKEYMKEPREIQIEAKQITLKEIDQVVIRTSDRGKQEALIAAIEEYKPFLAMIFCRTKKRANEINEALQELGYASDELHGDLTQAKREQVMKRFRDAKLEFLVATDVASRGLDVEGISHVFNYDIPQDVDSYIHRIGRTGRAGQQGVAVTLVSPHDLEYLDLIEKGIKMTIRKIGEAAAPRRARHTLDSGKDLSTRGEGSGRSSTTGPKGTNAPSGGRRAARTANPRGGERSGRSGATREYGAVGRETEGGRSRGAAPARGGRSQGSEAVRGRQAGAPGSFGGRAPRPEAAEGAARRIADAQGGRQYGASARGGAGAPRGERQYGSNPAVGAKKDWRGKGAATSAYDDKPKRTPNSPYGEKASKFGSSIRAEGSDSASTAGRNNRSAAGGGSFASRTGSGAGREGSAGKGFSGGFGGRDSKDSRGNRGTGSSESSRWTNSPKSGDSKGTRGASRPGASRGPRTEGASRSGGNSGPRAGGPGRSGGRSTR